MSYDAQTEWTTLYTQNTAIAYPAEGVIRILKGRFPDLAMPKPTSGKILDLGCGDGRHFPLFAQVGLAAYGTEISDSICATLKQNPTTLNIPFADIQFGVTNQLPFQEEFFDYLLAWNSCYYMSAGGTTRLPIACQRNGACFETRQVDHMLYSKKNLVYF